MSHQLLQEIEKKFMKKLPVIRPGYSVRISQKIREGEKERVQVFEGLVLGFNAGHGASKTIKVRKMVEGIGVEKTFPLYSPVITKIQVTKTPKVRRAKLFYMRNLAGKATRLKTQVGLAAKDEKFGKKRAEMLEAMGAHVAPTATAENTPIVEATPEQSEGATEGATTNAPTEATASAPETQSE